MIDILVFRPLISTTRRIEPAEKELVLNAARNIQHLTTMILNNNIDSLKLAEKLTKFATDVKYVLKVKATILNLRNERVQNTD